MKRRSEQTLETLKSTSNDDKERISNINNFKFERCDNKLGNMNNLLCIYETEKKNMILKEFIIRTLYLAAIEKYLKEYVEHIRYYIVANRN